MTFQRVISLLAPIQEQHKYEEVEDNNFNTIPENCLRLLHQQTTANYQQSAMKKKTNNN